MTPDRKEKFKLPTNALDRREFLRLMGASMVLAGMTSCGSVRYPTEEIVPYARQPREITPGEPLFYATAMTLGGYASGLLVESREGRPTKIEGNPLHPASLGATDVFAQASVLSLYDPDRSKNILHSGEISTWDDFLIDFNRNLTKQRANGGAGLRILTQTVVSPTLAAQIKEISQNFPNAVWHQYEPINQDNEQTGAIMAFGELLETVYKFDEADVVLSLEGDFLFDHHAHVRYARDFAKKRTLIGDKKQMNRLYVVEAMPSVTGSAADHRLALKQSEIENFARIIGAKFGLPTNPQIEELADKAAWINAVAEDLNEHRGSSIIVAGREQPPFVHALVHALNNALGNVGKTVFYTQPVAVNPVNQLESLRSLALDMNAGRVEMLVIVGGNPVYDAPADFYFTEALLKVPWRAHLSLYADETSADCQWHVPTTHELEMWSDARAFDGTVSVIQPLIAPLFNGKSPHELLAAFGENPYRSGYDLVREFWRKSSGNQNVSAANINTNQTNENANNSARLNSQTSANQSNQQTENQNNFEQNWRQYLRDGVIPNTRFTPKQVSLKTEFLNQNLQSEIPNPKSANPPASAGGSDGWLEIAFRPDPGVWDGRFVNNGWLQEVPKPITKLTWGNAALMSPATAKKFDLNTEVADTGGARGQVECDVAELIFGGVTVRAPVFIVEGHADDAVTVYLGYGRTRAGQIGNDGGFNAYPLRNSGAMWFGKNLEMRKTGERFSLACTQRHHKMEGRDLARFASLETYRANPNFAKHSEIKKEISLYPEWEYTGHQWGMAIDNNICIGCNACVVACQAENNIPVVGKKEVLRAREMHWIRIDQYFENDAILSQPVPCMHCEKAPCEVVCPVEATTHSAEGLNEMTYNRCVGTRYCSNNCPYKVRRFNFFGYTDFDEPIEMLQRNPEVTIRSRGVMEKCTYCVQRIQHAKIQSEIEERDLRDGEVVTACQQACPTEAIIFGDINDPNSRVSRVKREPRNYALLEELNTQPRTTYLATVNNLNEKIKDFSKS